MLRWLNAGESHGPSLAAIVEGLPAGLVLDLAAIDRQLWRRQQGHGRGRRMQIESDRVQIVSGLRFSRTLGTPLTILIENKDFTHWQDRMSPAGDPPQDLARVTRPRPGHADLAGVLKYDLSDARDALERASARSTATVVAAGAVARQVLEYFGVRIVSHIVRIGSESASEALLATLTPEMIEQRSEASPVRCADEQAGLRMVAAIDAAKEAGDTVGGVFEVVTTGIPVGLGSYATPDRRLDARLASALMGIQAIKGVEIGLGFRAAALPGSQVHDAILYNSQRGYYRPSNGAGGIEGGVSNGEPIVVRAAMKPIPTLYKPLPSVDIDTHAPFVATIERSDACAAPAAAVVGENAVAFALAQAFLEKFGGDSVAEIQRNYESYMSRVRER
jgi:chorismate synthase